MKIETRRRMLSSFAVLATSLSLIAVSIPASASANEGERVYDDLRDWWSAYGVEEAVQDELIENLELDVLPMAVWGESEPVQVISQETFDGLETIEVFADGSITVSSIQPSAPSGGVSSFAISGCSVSGGGGFGTFSNCTISQSSGIVSISFKAGYSRYSGGAVINSYSNASVSALYGSAPTPSLTLIRKNQVGTQPATVTAQTRYTSWNNGSSEDIYLSLRVTSASAWTTTY